MTDALGLALRVGLSLAIVLGLMWFVARVLMDKMGGRATGAVELLTRQQVGRGASIAVVRVADRALVLGVTEHAVTMLGEPINDLAAFATTPATPPGTSVVLSESAGRRPQDNPTPGALTAMSKPLAGSILSAATWRQALQVLRDRTVRRS